MGFAKLGTRTLVCLTSVLLSSLPATGAWQGSGPFGGSARSIAVDPQNRNTLLAGARHSLIFRSDDGGASWRLLPFPQGTPGTFGALIIHPTESGHFYAGLDAGDSADSGLYESKDGGQSWQPVAGLRGERIEALSMAPEDSNLLAAGTAKGVFLSTDGGTVWTRISNERNSEMQDITALAFDPTDPKIIYAGTPHLPWKTTDGGMNWRPIHSGLIDDSDIFSIRVDSKQPRLIYASACSGIYRSDDAGELWTKLRGIPGTHRRTHIITADPRNSDVIYAGTTLGLFKSPDAGKTWNHLTTEQVNWMVFDPTDPKTLYLATEYGGVLKSTDSGEKFAAANVGFANHRLTQITGTGKRIYASSIYEGKFGGVFSSDDGGRDWTLRANQDALGVNVNSLVAASSGEVLYAAGDDRVVKSTDGGKTWSSLPIQPKAVAHRPAPRIGRLRIHSFQALQAEKLVLLAGTQSGLFRNVGGSGWELVPINGSTATPVLAIYAPPRGATRVAVRTAQGLFVSDDVARTWRPAPLPDNSYYVYDVALPVDRDAPILAATSRGVLQSLDGGAHWTLISNGVPAATVDSLRFHPDRRLEAFLIQYGTVYHSEDGGTSWKPLPSDGLANSSIHTLWFAPDIPGRVFALSADRGALIFDLPQPDVAKQVPQVISTKN